MDFTTGKWTKEINTRDFIVRNYTPYEGDGSFLSAPSEKTKVLWEKTLDLMATERERGGVLDIDEKTISTIASHKPGYIDKDFEQVVGLQTDEPL